jgi:hypothetical protein
MELTAIATNVPLPQVIDEEKDDIGLTFFLRTKGKNPQQGSEEKE